MSQSQRGHTQNETDQSHNDAAAAEVSPAMARFTRVLVVIVVVLGVLLMAGLAVVVREVYIRMSVPANKMSNETSLEIAPPSVPISAPISVPSGPVDTEPAPVTLDLPTGLEVAHVTVSNGVLVVQMRRADAASVSDIVSFDMRSGKKIAHLRLP